MSDFDPYSSLVPVFHETEIPQRLRQIGTAIFANLWGEMLLLTAAHVIDEFKSGELLVPTELGILPIQGYIGHIDLPPEIPRSDDSVDIAYCRLSTRFAKALCHHFTPLPQARAELIRSASELTVCSASGYPASKAKKNGEKLSSEVFSFRGVVANEQTYEELGLSQTTSIVIHFHKKRAVHHGTLEPFPTPGLRGISGGAIFAWPPGAELSEDWTLPRLVGIVHSFKEREGLIIGTTLVPVVGAISLGRMKGFGGVE
jgi:hypothetical protein